MRSRKRNPKRPSSKWRAPRITEVRDGSPCRGLVEEGDNLLAIGGRPPLDVLDCLQAAEPARLSLRLSRHGKEASVRVRKQSGEPLGLVFDEAVFDGVHLCRNKCVFCFVDQMPPGLRPTLYIKDDDYRLSFYYGNFITLNNLLREDLERIVCLRLSPLYVSLHSTNPELRGRMMGGDGSSGLEALKKLLSAGIEVHLQVVACPGLNDGQELERTLRDVLVDYGKAASLGVVPVGITSHASGDALKPHDAQSSSEVIEVIQRYQADALENRGDLMFFAADEFYLMAGRDFPVAEEYEMFPQLENGIGMARKLIDEAHEYLSEVEDLRGAVRGVITGMAGETILSNIFTRAGAKVEVLPVTNGLFGPRVTVTCLLSGADIIAAIKAREPRCREMIIPDTLLREGRFLDDMSPEDIAEETGVDLIPIEVNGGALLAALGFKKKGR